MPRTTFRSFGRRAASLARRTIAAASLLLPASPLCLADVRHTALILCDGLHADALRDAQLPALRDLARTGAVGLMTMPPGLARSPYSAMLSIATGAPASGHPTDADAFHPTEVIEGGYAMQVLSRRTGTEEPTTADGPFFVHIGIGSLIRRGYAAHLPAARHTYRWPHRTVPLSLDTSVWSRDGATDLRLGSLMAVGPSGIGRVSDGSDLGIVIVQVGRSRHELDRQIRRWATQAQRIWVLSYCPASNEVHSYLSRPTLTVLWEQPARGTRQGGSGTGQGATLTSATTRTAGLISFTDIAPTLMEWIGLAADANLPGHAVISRAHADPLGFIQASDRVAATNAGGMVTVLMIYGILAGVGIACGLAALRLRPRSSRLAGRLCCACMPLPIAFLLTGPVARCATGTVSPVTLAAAIGIACLLIWALAELIARAWFGARPVAPMVLVISLTAVTIVADGVTGQHLIKDSVLAAAGRAGARYYGIGNEYMGFLVAAGLGLTCLLQARVRVAAALGLVIVGTLGLGSVGANAGGVVTATTGFLACIAHRTYGRLSTRIAVLCFAAGIALAVAFASLDRAIAGAGASHLGAAVGRATDGDAGALLTIASRKAGLTVASILSPHGLFSLIGFAALLVTALAGFRRDLEWVGNAYYGWARWHAVSVPTALAAFVANDTGIVPMLIIYGSCLMVGLTLRFVATNGT